MLSPKERRRRAALRIEVEAMAIAVRVIASPHAEFTITCSDFSEATLLMARVKKIVAQSATRR